MDVIMSHADGTQTGLWEALALLSYTNLPQQNKGPWWYIHILIATHLHRPALCSLLAPMGAGRSSLPELRGVNIHLFWWSLNFLLQYVEQMVKQKGSTQIDTSCWWVTEQWITFHIHVLLPNISKFNDVQDPLEKFLPLIMAVSNGLFRQRPTAAITPVTRYKVQIGLPYAEIRTTVKQNPIH